MQDYERLARRIAQKYRAYCGGAVDMDDLMQAAAIGALRAEATYTPDKGTWPAWAAYYIRNEMRAAVGNRSTKRDPSVDALSLDRTLTEDGQTLADLLEDADRIVVEEAERQELRSVVRQEVAALPAQRRRVIEMVDLQGKTKTQAAGLLSCTPYRLNVIRHEAYRDLRYNPRLCALAIARGYSVPHRRRRMWGSGGQPPPPDPYEENG
ncbi:MAG: sigma-70 family RNA polymerase sigma factor [Clostridia bacterium]|nr:sigma-70 family RNA polymerase sigma factor [Clostridia bacterium]